MASKGAWMGLFGGRVGRRIELVGKIILHVLEANIHILNKFINFLEIILFSNHF